MPTSALFCYRTSLWADAGIGPYGVFFYISSLVGMPSMSSKSWFSPHMPQMKV